MARRRSITRSIPTRLRGIRPRGRDGRFLSKRKDARQRAYYVEKAQATEKARRRSEAATKAARTRKRQKFTLRRQRDVRRKPAARIPRPQHEGQGARRDYLVSFQFSAGKKSYRRDLLVPAARGASERAIVAQARQELPAGASSLLPFLTLKNAVIFAGPDTTRKRTEMR